MLRKILTCCSLLILTSCSSSNNDALESYNRKMYSFNKFFDGMIMKPLAVGYKNITPTPINNAVSNFFSNLNDLTVIVNNIFQLNFSYLKTDVPRFILNTTFGVMGFIDVADSFDLEKRDNDFGLTLARWGYENSSYFVFPILGPSTVRDSFGRVVDALLPISPFRIFVLDGNHRIGIFVLKFIDLRADLLGVGRVVNTASIDEYAFVRDAYLQRRGALITASASRPDTDSGSKGSESMSDAVNVLLEDEHFGDEALFADALKEESKKQAEEKKKASEKNKKDNKNTKESLGIDKSEKKEDK